MKRMGFEGHVSCAPAANEMTSAARKRKIRFIGASYIHVHSLRIASGQEVLVARVVSDAGRVGYGFSFRLDATEARHMAAWNAGLGGERPRIEPALAHPWETAWVANGEIDWHAEPGFARLEW